MNQPVPTPYSAPPRQIWAWGVGAIVKHILIGTYGQATAIFTLGFVLNAALVSWAIRRPRLIDSTTDPLPGHLSDNTHPRRGRRKPFLRAPRKVFKQRAAAAFLLTMKFENTFLD